MVKQPKEDGGFSTSVLKLQTLSNMDCEPAELADLLAAMAQTDPSPVDDINKRYVAQVKQCSYIFCMYCAQRSCRKCM